MPRKKVVKKTVPNKPSGIKYQPGNGEGLIVALLNTIAQKLDNIQNHTVTIVEQQQELIKAIEDNG